MKINTSHLLKLRADSPNSGMMLTAKTKAILTTLILLMNWFCAVAQNRPFELNIPYNQKWEISDQKIASYYRHGTLEFGKVSYFTGVINDYYADGKLQMNGVYDAKGLKQGLFTFYYKNGKVEREGHFEKNDLSGLWSYYDINGNLIAKINCTTHRDFTIVYYKDKSGKELIKDGNGKFIINLSEYPQIIWTSSDVPIKYIEGTVTNGLRVGEWKYYSDASSSSPLSYKGNTLTFIDLYKNGKFRYGNSFPVFGGENRYRKIQNQLTVFPKKEVTVGDFAGDFAFGGPEVAGKAIYNFFFNNVKPTVVSTSLFYKNNFKDYINCVEAALYLTTDQQLDVTPDLDFEKDSWVFFDKVTKIQPGDVIPSSGKAEIQFNVMKDGKVKNVSVNSDLPADFNRALTYYLSIIRNQSPKLKEDSALVKLNLVFDYQTGYKDKVKSYVSLGTLSTNEPDLSFRKYLVKDSLVLTTKPPVFAAGLDKWNAYLKAEMKKVTKIVPEDYRDNLTLNFTVDENGFVKDVNTKAEQDYDPQFLELTKRILRNSPKWTPAELDGKKMKYKLTQIFQYFQSE
jgi:antitoxin component YwqK of YwqJK toxin-antitoxin module